MHNAPAVSYRVGRSRFQGSLVGVTALSGVLTGILWNYQANPGDWRQWFFTLTIVGVFLFAVRAWRRTPAGSLSWDGQVWKWTCAEVSSGGLLTVHLDLQYWMVLSLRTDAGVRIWLWPERQVDFAHWNDLRRAVFSRGTKSNALNTSSETDVTAPG